MTTLKFAITMGTNAGSMTEGMSFHSAEVDVMTPTNGTNQTMLNPTNEATTGSVSLTVFGVGLGTVDKTEHLRRATTNCEVTDWISETRVSCRSVRGVFSSLHVVATVGNRVTSTSEALSFDRLELVLVSDHPTRNCNDTGVIAEANLQANSVDVTVAQDARADYLSNIASTNQPAKSINETVTVHGGLDRRFN